jgi:hypothetical protein
VVRRSRNGGGLSYWRRSRTGGDPRRRIVHADGLFNNSAVQDRRIDQAKSLAYFNERRRRRWSLSRECRCLNAMMPVKGMIEFRSRGMFVPFLFFDIEVRVQLTAVFGSVRLEERLVHKPRQKACDAVGHGCRAAHSVILRAALWQVNDHDSEENFRNSHFP